MRTSDETGTALDDRIASRLKTLRSEQGWSLEVLAERSGVSRATLSRLEKAEVSPTASVLGKLCAAYRLTLTRLIAMVEPDFAPLVRRDQRQVWTDPETGFNRRLVSPPSDALAAEVLECEIPADTRIAYDKPSKPGLEHHIVMLGGCLQMTVDGQSYRLETGDCLRYRLFGPSVFETTAGAAARYLLVML